MSSLTVISRIVPLSFPPEEYPKFFKDLNIESYDCVQKTVFQDGLTQEKYSIETIYVKEDLSKVYQEDPNFAPLTSDSELIQNAHTLEESNGFSFSVPLHIRSVSPANRSNSSDRKQGETIPFQKVGTTDAKAINKVDTSGRARSSTCSPDQKANKNDPHVSNSVKAKLMKGLLKKYSVKSYVNKNEESPLQNKCPVENGASNREPSVGSKSSPMIPIGDSSHEQGMSRKSTRTEVKHPAQNFGKKLRLSPQKPRLSLSSKKPRLSPYKSKKVELVGKEGSYDGINCPSQFRGRKVDPNKELKNLSKSTSSTCSSELELFSEEISSSKVKSQSQLPGVESGRNEKVIKSNQNPHPSHLNQSSYLKHASGSRMHSKNGGLKSCDEATKDTRELDKISPECNANPDDFQKMKLVNEKDIHHEERPSKAHDMNLDSHRITLISGLDVSRLDSSSLLKTIGEKVTHLKENNLSELADEKFCKIKQAIEELDKLDEAILKLGKTEKPTVKIDKTEDVINEIADTIENMDEMEGAIEKINEMEEAIDKMGEVEEVVERMGKVEEVVEIISNHDAIEELDKIADEFEKMSELEKAIKKLDNLKNLEQSEKAFETIDKNKNNEEFDKIGTIENMREMKEANEKLKGSEDVLEKIDKNEDTIESFEEIADAIGQINELEEASKKLKEIEKTGKSEEAYDKIDRNEDTVDTFDEIAETFGKNNKIGKVTENFDESTETAETLDDIKEAIKNFNESNLPASDNSAQMKKLLTDISKFEMVRSNEKILRNSKTVSSCQTKLMDWKSTRVQGCKPSKHSYLEKIRKIKYSHNLRASAVGSSSKGKLTSKKKSSYLKVERNKKSINNSLKLVKPNLSDSSKVHKEVDSSCESLVTASEKPSEMSADNEEKLPLAEILRNNEKIKNFQEGIRFSCDSPTLGKDANESNRSQMGIGKVDKLYITLKVSNKSQYPALKSPSQKSPMVKKGSFDEKVTEERRLIKNPHKPLTSSLASATVGIDASGKQPFVSKGSQFNIEKKNKLKKVFKNSPKSQFSAFKSSGRMSPVVRKGHLNERVFKKRSIKKFHKSVISSIDSSTVMNDSIKNSSPTESSLTQFGGVKMNKNEKQNKNQEPHLCAESHISMSLTSTKSQLSDSKVNKNRTPTTARKPFKSSIDYSTDAKAVDGKAKQAEECGLLQNEDKKESSVKDVQRPHVPESLIEMKIPPVKKSVSNVDKTPPKSVSSSPSSSSKVNACRKISISAESSQSQVPDSSKRLVKNLNKPPASSGGLVKHGDGKSSPCKQMVVKNGKSIKTTGSSSEDDFVDRASPKPRKSSHLSFHKRSLVEKAKLTRKSPESNLSASESPSQTSCVSKKSSIDDNLVKNENVKKLPGSSESPRPVLHKERSSPHRDKIIEYKKLIKNFQNHSKAIPDNSIKSRDLQKDAQVKETSQTKFFDKNGSKKLIKFIKNHKPTLTSASRMKQGGERSDKKTDRSEKLVENPPQSRTSAIDGVSQQNHGIPKEENHKKNSEKTKNLLKHSHEIQKSTVGNTSQTKQVIGKPSLCNKKDKSENLVKTCRKQDASGQSKPVASKRSSCDDQIKNCVENSPKHPVSSFGGSLGLAKTVMRKSQSLDNSVDKIGKSVKDDRIPVVPSLNRPGLVVKKSSPCNKEVGKSGKSIKDSPKPQPSSNPGQDKRAGREGLLHEKPEIGEKAISKPLKRHSSALDSFGQGKFVGKKRKFSKECRLVLMYDPKFNRKDKFVKKSKMFRAKSNPCTVSLFK